MTVRPFSFGDMVVAPGELAHGWFELAALSTGHVERLPVTILHGRAPGPVLWLTANIHGDEVTGLSVVHALVGADLLSELRGTIVAIPTLNPAGLHTRRRESFLDRRDPNRLFPGFPDEPGADHERPSVLEVGYARLFAELRREDERPEALELARRLEQVCAWTHLPIVNEVPARRYLDAKLHRSTSGAALLQAKIPAITVELGLTGGVDPAARAIGIAAVLNVLRGAGMLPGQPAPIAGLRVPPLPFPVMRDLVPRARATGILHYLVEPGDVVRIGDRLATLSDIHGRPFAGGEILAEHDGWILALPRGAVCFEGEAVVHMAVRDDGPLAEKDPTVESAASFR